MGPDKRTLNSFIFSQKQTLSIGNSICRAIPIWKTCFLGTYIREAELFLCSGWQQTPVPPKQGTCFCLILRLKSCSIPYWQWQQRTTHITATAKRKRVMTTYQCSAWHTGLLGAQTLGSGLNKLAGTWLHKHAYICITSEEPVLTSLQGHCLGPVQSPVEPDGTKLISDKHWARDRFFSEGHKEGLHLASLCVCHQLFLGFVTCTTPSGF